MMDMISVLMVASPPSKSDRNSSGVSRRDRADSAPSRAKKAEKTVRHPRRVSTTRPNGGPAQECRDDELELPPVSSWYGG